METPAFRAPARLVTLLGIVAAAACSEGATDPVVVQAVRLAFSGEPADAEGNVAIGGVRVAVVDAGGDVVTNATNAVTISLSTGPVVAGAPATLMGTTTVNAVDGFATFADLRLDRPADGYRLQATAASLESDESEPFRVSLTFQTIDVSDDFVCGRTPGGTYCWGRAGSGQLGAGPSVISADQPAPVLVAGGHTFTALATGNSFSSHACALTAGGAPYCWGENERGQLGSEPAGTDIFVTTPTPVSGGLTFLAMGSGRFHSCGVVSGGSAYCWGENLYGQLGDGSIGAPVDATPSLVLGGLAFTSITGAREHTCAITAAGAAWCWGQNDFGMLGDDNAPTQRLMPVGVVGTAVYRSIDAGDRHTCGLTDAQEIRCWGLNAEGALGAVTASSTVDVPVVVSGGHQWAMVETGALHTCGLTTGGVAYCWGRGSGGALGRGTGSQVNSTSPVLVAGGHTFTAISAGESLSCGLTAAGDVYCWGQGTSGQLGDGTFTDLRDVPARIIQ